MNTHISPPASEKPAPHENLNRAALRGLLAYGLPVLALAACVLLPRKSVFLGFGLVLTICPPLAAMLVQPPGSAWSRRIIAAVLAYAGCSVGGFIAFMGIMAQQARLDMEWLAVTTFLGFAVVGFSSGIVHGFRAALAAALAFGLPAAAVAMTGTYRASWYFILLLSMATVCGGPVLGVMAALAKAPPGFATRRQMWKLAVVSVFLLSIGWSLTFFWINFQKSRGEFGNSVNQWRATDLQRDRLQENKRETLRQSLMEHRKAAPPQPFLPASNPELDPLR